MTEFEPPTPAQRKVIARLLGQRRAFSRSLDRYAIAVMLHAIGSPQACDPDTLEGLRFDFEASFGRYIAQLAAESGGPGRPSPTLPNPNVSVRTGRPVNSRSG